MTKENKPLLSIIIAAYNEENKIQKCLEALLDQNYKNIEIFVIDDGSTDKTKEIIKKFSKGKKIFLLEQNRQGPGAAKNLAVKKAKGEILVFVDADEYVQKNYIEKLTIPLIKGESKTSIGAWRIAYPKSPWARCRFGDTSKIRHHAVKSGVFRSIKKDFFEKLGGFDVTKGYSDDRIPNEAKRSRVEDAIFDHDVDSNPQELFQKRKWIGSSIKTNPKNILFWKKIIFSSLMLTLFLVSFWISLWMSLGIFILGTLPIFYYAIKKSFLYKDWRLIFYYPIYFVIIMLGMIMGFLKPVYNK